MKPVRKLVISALIMCIYIVIMFVTQGFAFGQFQIRLATSLYAFSYMYPFLIVPLGIANLLSNITMGGLGPLDMIGGMIVGILTALFSYTVRRFKLNEWLIALGITFIPGLLVPVWLSYLLHIPYRIMALSLCVGQIIPGILGVILIKQLKNILPKVNLDKSSDKFSV